MIANQLVALLLAEGEEPEEWFMQQPKPNFVIKEDGVYPGWYSIPLPREDGFPSGRVNLINLSKSEDKAGELKKRLNHLVTHRDNFVPGMVYLSPFGNFEVTATGSVVEA